MLESLLTTCGYPILIIGTAMLVWLVHFYRRRRSDRSTT
jgi:hypothetical protein